MMIGFGDGNGQVGMDGMMILSLARIAMHCKDDYGDGSDGAVRLRMRVAPMMWTMIT